MLLSEAYENFIEDKKLYGLAERTIEDYAEFLKPFVAFIGEDTPAEVISNADIKRYIATFHSRDLAKATIATYTRHIKVFLNWLSDETETSYNVRKLPMPRVPKKNVYLYTPEDIKLIFDTIDAKPEWIAFRNCAAIALMLDSGLRRNEVCTIKTSRLNVLERLLTVTGKGSKDRTVPLGKLSLGFIERYRRACPWDTSETLFVDRHGDPLTNNGLKLMVQRLSEKLPFAFSCHKLRHNFATNYCVDMYEKYGHMDAYSLQIMLGHADLQTTMVYIHHAKQIVASKASLSHIDKISEILCPV